ncbi:hypothetical protein M3223_12925 [Paenibacillus pasadenensis]|uniref:hypothetical protein n=1 Tax=Paenibacillus pasadenensis TaxID=217090 RepID=UPI00203DA01D|nr:hypothetical protein [Paenibacillus pasadenensis]MCM3748257.1 hypothetical protein [Paenibacillus pasadenensis]
MKAWWKWGMGIVGAAIMLAGGGAYAADYAVKQALSGLASELPAAAVQEETVLSGSTGSESAGTSETESSGSPGAEPNQSAGSSTRSSEGASASGASDTSRTQQKPDAADKAGIITEDAADSAAKRLTIAEKSEALGMVLKSLDKSEIQQFKQFAKGGLDAGEKQKIKETLRDKLSKPDYARLSELAKKALQAQ